MPPTIAPHTTHSGPKSALDINAKVQTVSIKCDFLFS